MAIFFNRDNRSTNTRLSCRWLAAIGVLMLAAPTAADQPPAGVSGEEWVSIQGQIDAERHRIVESDRPGRLYRADNPVQRFTAHFGAEDVVIVPRGRGEPVWELGMQLTAWGAAHHLQPVHPAGAIAEDNRVEYRRGPLTEWYVNTAMGLEQGFIIEAPPDHGITELVLEMTISGDFTPNLVENRQAVTFRHKAANTALTYSNLASWDAADAHLEARMDLTAAGSKLRLVIDVAGAAWPVTVDPIIQKVAKLLPTPDLQKKYAFFGRSVSLNGDFMVVGLEDDEHGESAGAAYVFHREHGGAGAWGPVARLTADDASATDDFGFAVAISGDTVIVGAWGDDDSGPDSGAAYVFQRDHGGVNNWGQVAKITAEDSGSPSSFGSAVAIHADTAVIGAPNDEDGGVSSGSAYVFNRNEGGANAWGQTTKITPTDGEDGDWFGAAVTIDGDTAVIGAQWEDATGPYFGAVYVFGRNEGGTDAWGQIDKVVPTDGSDLQQFGSTASISEDTILVGARYDSGVGTNTGSAFVFRRDQGGPNTWGQVAKISPAGNGDGDYFGSSVSISGDTAVVSARWDDDNGADSGAAYVFQRDLGGPDAWSEVAKIGASDATTDDSFGFAVSISGDTVAAGAPGTGYPGESTGSVYLFARDQGGSGAWGESAKQDCPSALTAESVRFGSSVSVDFDTAIVGAPNSYFSNHQDPGSAYLFARDRTSSNAWGLITKLNPADGDPGDEFGTSVSISGDTAIVGAPRDDDVVYTSGSAYIFQRDHGGSDAWGLVAKITASDPEGNDQFGISVAIDNDTAVVGAWGDEWGSGYIFQRDFAGPGTWGEVTKITSSAGSQANYFGEAVSISGDTIVVGAKANSSGNAGSAFIFERNHGGPDAWGEVTQITPHDGEGFDIFGRAVCIVADSVIVGAPGHDHAGLTSGAAYLFQRNHGGPGAWGLVVELLPEFGSTGGSFGDSVATHDAIAVVGARSDDSLGQSTGSAFVFERDRGGSDAWGQAAMIPPPNPGDEGYFGKSVAVSVDTVIIGASSSDLGSASGTAYIFIITETLFNDGFESGDTSAWSATEP